MSTTTLGQPNAVAILFFFMFVLVTLGITYWAARRTKTTSQFYVISAELRPTTPPRTLN